MIDLQELVLAHGAHESRERGVCIMEAVAWVAGEPHSDHPACACPVAAAALRAMNDRLDDAERQRLKVYIPRLIGTATDGKQEARAFLAMDWIIRTYTPTWLDLAKVVEPARALRDLPEIVDLASLTRSLSLLETARSARAAARTAAWDAAGDAAWDAARTAAWDAAGAAAWDAAGAAAWDAAWDAAGAAAGDAARDAARAAARAAAWDAAWDAARDAAGDAAWDAAWDAARDAAGDALQPTVVALRESFFAVLDRMIPEASV